MQIIKQKLFQALTVSSNVCIIANNLSVNSCSVTETVVHTKYAISATWLINTAAVKQLFSPVMRWTLKWNLTLSQKFHSRC